MSKSYTHTEKINMNHDTRFARVENPPGVEKPLQNYLTSIIKNLTDYNV